VDGMSSNSPFESKKALAEQMWLSYFNRTLFEKGLITETQRNRMQNMINTRKPSTAKR
jgi:hypothetical protein